MAVSTMFAALDELPSTESLILNAAIVCVKRWGIERVTLHDIAREAGVARSTLYNHYSNRDDVIREALLQSAYGFGMKMFECVQKFEGEQQRLIEATLFALKTLPEEPSLALLSDASLSKMVQEHSLTTPQGLDIGTALLKAILTDHHHSVEALQEMSEACIRFMLSLVTMQSPYQRNDEQWRGFIARRLLPSLGLAVPDQYLLPEASHE